MTQIEINKLLYEAAVAPQLDTELIEEIINEGADPLGQYNTDEEFVLEALFSDGQDREFAKRLPLLVEVFLKHGMDIEKSEWNVLHCLTWVRDEYGIQTLMNILDAGISASYAESFTVELIGDILMFEAGHYDSNTSFNDYTWSYSMEYAIKMILLIASYEQIFHSSRYIRELVCAKIEDADQLSRFRRWDDYQCEYTFNESIIVSPSGEKIRNIRGKARAREIGSNMEIRELQLIGILDTDYTGRPVNNCDT